jgi:tripartite-type tricarboxylate transporter receptor subunit TctC
MQSIGAPIKIELLGDANGATTATVGGATAGGVIPKSEVIHHVEADRARVLAVLE